MNLKKDKSLVLGIIGAGIIFAAVAAIYFIAPETIHGFATEEIEVTVQVNFAGFAEDIEETVYAEQEETTLDALEAVADVEYVENSIAINNIENSEEYAWQYEDTTLSENDVVKFEYTKIE